jgi:chromosome segregation ATPase
MTREVQRLEELVATLKDELSLLQEQLQSKDGQLESKDRQIEQLHVLLQHAQAVLPAPRDNRSWWRFWER